MKENVERKTLLTEEELVESFFVRMSLPEKIAQLCGIRPNDLLGDNGKLCEEKCKALIPNGIGHLCQYASSVKFSPEELRDFIVELQGWLRENTPCGIPVAPQEEAITGLAASGATTYPQHLGSACSWNPDLIRRKNAATAESMRKVGAVLALSPMIDLCRSAHWSRIEESFGEDAYLTAALGVAFVSGMQQEGFRKGVAATTKHFAGYGSSNSDPQEFMEEMIFPHETAFHVAGAQVVMPGYHAIDDIPCISNRELLVDILRRQLGFDGMVISDYGAVRRTISSGYAKDEVDAAAKSLMNGNDVDLPAPDIYLHLEKALQNGSVTQSRFDDAVKRILRFKARAGLLDPKPEFGARGSIDLNPPEQQNLAYEMATQSIVLLKNNGILPLDFSGKKIALLGPNANSIQALLGDYTYQSISSFWWHLPIHHDFPRLTTLESGLRSVIPADSTLLVERGCDWSRMEEISIDDAGDPRLSQLKEVENAAGENFSDVNPDLAVRFAQTADVVIAAMGENIMLCGEGRMRNGISLPGQQEQFVQTLLATGKPVILIVFGGRPQVITALAEKCAAVIQAWFPGQAGGKAVADILCGKVNPSAKLCVSYPADGEKRDLSYTNDYAGREPLFPFGYGLSYTEYAYSDMTLPLEHPLRNGGRFPVRCRISNRGNYAGTEIVQLYRLETKGLPIPVKPKKLIGFARITLQPGESGEVEFDVSPEQLASYDAATKQWLLVPGEVVFGIGKSSRDILLSRTIRFTGNAAVMKRRSEYFSEVRIQTKPSNFLK